MAQSAATPMVGRPVFKDLGILLLLLGTILVLIFARSFDAHSVLFANDAPLGLISAESGQSASTLDGLVTGYWQDLQWIGIEQPSILPSLSFWFYQLWQSPVLNAKFYSPVSLLFLGFTAWLFFRQLGFRNAICILGAIATALNMNTFSHVMWGLPSRALAQAAVFLALAALQSATIRYFWIKAILGGMAVGLAIMEGFDVGALYSLYVAAFAIFIVFARDGAPTKKAIRAGLLLAVVALCAAWFSAHALYTLIGTQIKGVAGMQQDEATRQARWDSATMWSLPKAETFRVIIPGLFGYGMDAMGYKTHEDGSGYWGAVGQSPGDPASRHSGAGEYAGCLVVLVGIWAIASGWRKQGSPFSPLERKYILFWSGTAVISLLFAWGRHAPFYQVLYSLPYFSTIRNPIKFMHMFHLSLLILFAFGLEGLFRQYIDRAAAATNGLNAHLRSWWKQVTGFDRKWVLGCLAFGAVAIIGYLIYYSSSREVIAHLKTGGFSDPQAQAIASFSFKDVGFFLLFFFLSFAAVLLVMSGWLAGTRWKIAFLLFGAILAVDLARANHPWIVYYDYKERYSSSPLFEILDQDAHSRRVTSKLAPFSGLYMVDDQHATFAYLYHFWLQNQFQYLDIHALEVAQMPRIPELDSRFLAAMGPTPNEPPAILSRLWQLTSTRWLLGMSGYLDILNGQVLPGQNAFRIRQSFEVVPKAGQSQAAGPDEITTQLVPQGTYALMEFTNTVPRVSLFSNWQVITNDEQTLSTLRDMSFNPLTTLLVSDQVPAPQGTNTNAATVPLDFAQYSSKEFEVKTDSAQPGILHVTDKYSPHWKVWVDGKPETLLRCNFLMRGVYVPAGSHTVVFRYRPPVNSLYVTAGAMLVGILLCGFLGWQWQTARKKVS